MKTTRVLIVEDLDYYQKLYKNLVEKQPDCKVEVAPSIAASKDLLNRYTFALALVDLSLNEEHANRDGFEVLKMIRQLNEGTVSIILTAHGDIPDADKAFTELSISGFIDKAKTPLEETRKRIDKLIEDSKSKDFSSIKKIDNITNYFTSALQNQILGMLKAEQTDLKAKELESFLKRLLVGFIPLLPSVDGFEGNKNIYTIDGYNTIRIPLWSKMTGTAVEAWFGGFELMNNAMHPANEKMHLPNLKQDEMLLKIFDSYSFPSFGGAVYVAKNLRSEFVIQLS